MKQIPAPVYGTRLTLGILEGRLKENGVDSSNLHSVMAGDIINIGCFSVGFIRVNHSIPDAVGLSIKTPVGMIVHTGDFKLDYTPVDGQMTDFRRFSDLGNKGVLLLLADSTNADASSSQHSPRMCIASSRSLTQRSSTNAALRFSGAVWRTWSVFLSNSAI